MAEVLLRGYLSLRRRQCQNRGMTEETTEISLTVNGEQVTRTVPVRRHLVDFLRLDLNLTGSHLACEHGVCGACTIRVDGVVARGCLMLAVQANGADVVTIEGLSASGEVADCKGSSRHAMRPSAGSARRGWC